MKFTINTTTALTTLMAAAAFALAGCDTLRGKGGVTPTNVSVFTPRPTAPNVLVVEGVIVLDQDPLVFGAKERGVEKTITWRLDPRDPRRFTFDPANGITIEGRDAANVFKCGPIENNFAFQCLNRHPAKGSFTYTIRLLDGTGKPLPPGDPIIHNL